MIRLKIKLLIGQINLISQKNLRQHFQNILFTFLLPTLVYSTELTEEETTQAQNNVSRYTGIVNENERIIARHDRITKDIKLKIESYKESKGELIGQWRDDTSVSWQIFSYRINIVAACYLSLFIQERNIF